MTPTNTIRIHQVFKCPTDRLYKAFLDGDAMAKWLPPNGFVCKCDKMDTTVGGSFKMTFRNFANGHTESFGGEFKELVPNKRIRYVNRFDNPAFEGEITATILINEVIVGSEVHITQEGVPGIVPAEACYLGWQESLVLLKLLVEAEISEQC